MITDLVLYFGIVGTWWILAYSALTLEVEWLETELVFVTLAMIVGFVVYVVEHNKRRSKND